MKLCFISLLLLLTACSDKGLNVHQSESVDWQSLRGQWVYINYWALWCKPCREEMPELNALSKESNSVVFGVNFDGVVGQTLTDQIDDLNVQFTVLEQDPAVHLGYQRPQVLPATMVFTPEGELQEILLGPQTKASLLQLQH